MLSKKTKQKTMTTLNNIKDTVTLGGYNHRNGQLQNHKLIF